MWQLQGRFCAGLCQGCDLYLLSVSSLSCSTCLHLPSASFPGPLGVLPPELGSLGCALLSASPVSPLRKWDSSASAPVSPRPWPYTAHFMDAQCMAVRVRASLEVMGLQLLGHSPGRKPSEAWGVSYCSLRPSLVKGQVE